MTRSVAPGRIALLLVFVACGAEDERALESTIGTLELVRGPVAASEQDARPITRIAAGAELRAGQAALARLTLDRGPSLWLGPGAHVKVTSSESLRVSAGRLLVSAGRDQRLDVETASGSLRVADAEVSIDARAGRVGAYVVRGEVGWATSRDRGVVDAGHEVAMSARGIEARAAVLWSDWTAGLAQAGPEVEARGAGVGVLEARVPEEVGLARWPLVVRRLDVRVVITGDLAVTDVEQVFFNPASEPVEGIYRFRVPEGGVLSRFAVDREGQLVEGFVREKVQARADYEAQVYRGSTDDPALLEWDSPGRYQARIYPIPAGATRRIVVRYAEWLSRSGATGPRLYRYPLGGRGGGPGGLSAQELSLVVDVERSGATRVRAGLDAKVEGDQVLLRRSDFRPTSDFWLELVDSTARPGLAAVRAPYVRPRRPIGSGAPAREDERDLLFVPVVLPARWARRDEHAERGGARAGIDLVIVADVSAATDASHLELGRSAVESLVAHLGAEDRVALATSDVSVRWLEHDAARLGPASPERIDRVLATLARAPSGGATDLGATLAQAASVLSPERRAAIVYVGDAMATVGERDAGDLRARLDRLPHPVRIYGIGVGVRAKMELLETIASEGGLAARVVDRASAAHAATRVLAHAARDVVHDVEVSLPGASVDGVYPRRARDVTIGEVLPVLARVRGALPREVVVRGVLDGRRVSARVPLEVRDVREASEDLRLRWAGERLRHLLADGAGREEVTELGTRYGLITPYTSFYVPSAREAREALERRGQGSEEAPEAEDRPTDTEGGRGRRHRGDEGAMRWREPPTRAAPGSFEPSASAPPAAARIPRPAPVTPSPAPVVAAPPMQGETSGSGGAAVADRTRVAARVALGAPEVRGPLSADVVARVIRQHLGEIRLCYERGLATQPDLHGRVTVRFVVSAGGVVQSATGASTNLRDPSVERCIVMAFRRWSFPAPAGGGIVLVTQSITLTAGDAHQMEPTPGRIPRGRDVPSRSEPPPSYGPADAVIVEVAASSEAEAGVRARRCGEAARLPFDDRVALWRERLALVSLPSHWVALYEGAARACELPGWRDRRAFLDAILDRAPDVGTMLDVFRALTGSAREHVRRAILARVRTAADLRTARDALGLVERIDWTAIDRELEAAPGIDARIRVLRRLVRTHPTSFALSLRLLAAYEEAARLPEAERLADVLRRDPWADPAVRTAVGELWIRRGRVDEARRAFSEMVEHAPDDAGARRRLGDLYRAHGWFDDAYRQYRTLARLRPDDPGASLLLAQAAAGAGRVDEALRLEQSVAETGEPGGAAAGIVRLARLRIASRLAKLRHEARGANDAGRLAAIVARGRRTGALADAGALRVVLAWSHPDASLALWAAHPGQSLARAPELFGEHGLEAFEVIETMAGDHPIEVRRSGDARASVTAELLVTWDEGERDERIEVVPLRFEPGQRTRAFTIRGRALTPSP
ncbi:MAG: AgmX/PglI C-terminal domain-containing protein [Deltaproteobacteria bacterium]|nr:AgmX/PglI C-terminal domain-containing protein [Deltaproteobacteria bacterium]